MTDESKIHKAQVENLELNQETVADLTEKQAEEAEGGAVADRQSLIVQCSYWPLCKD